MANRRGGARSGAGRKPKALIYGEQGQVLEQKIADALPEIIDKLIEMAKNGDVRAARYLVDRILGRVSRLPSPPVEDRTLPYTEADLEKDNYHHDRKIKFFHEDRENDGNPHKLSLAMGLPTLADFLAAKKDSTAPELPSLRDMLYDQLERRLSEPKPAG